MAQIDHAGLAGGQSGVQPEITDPRRIPWQQGVRLRIGGTSPGGAGIRAIDGLRLIGL